MKTKIGEQGEMNVLLIPVILLSLLFIGAASFAYWAFSSRQDYKNNTDAKISVAVQANTQSVQTADAKRFAQEAKDPLTLYQGPDAYGSIKVYYPKTWSAYVDTTSTNTPVDAYFHTGFVPSTQSMQTYNLRVQVNSQPYNTVMQQYSGLLSDGTVTASPYSLPKEPNIIGTKLTGQINLQNPQVTNGTMIVLPLRSTTLLIWTESADYLSDFNNSILPNLTFSP